MYYSLICRPRSYLFFRWFVLFSYQRKLSNHNHSLTCKNAIWWLNRALHIKWKIGQFSNDFFSIHVASIAFSIFFLLLLFFFISNANLNVLFLALLYAYIHLKSEPFSYLLNIHNFIFVRLPFNIFFSTFRRAPLLCSQATRPILNANGSSFNVDDLKNTNWFFVLDVILTWIRCIFCISCH